MLDIEYPDKSDADLAQAATGEGFDPDQTWEDEPDDEDLDLDDPDDTEPKQAVIEDEEG